MSISAVSFRSTAPVQSTSFQDKIKQPQAYTSKDTPSAATGLDKNEKKKGSFGKKLLAAVLILASGAGILVGAKKFGKLKNPEGTLSKIADFIENIAGKVAKFFSGLGKSKVDAGEAAEAAAEGAKEVFEEGAKAAAEGAKEAVKEGVKATTEGAVKAATEGVKEAVTDGAKSLAK